jgi:hypothetical protein
VYDYIYNLCSHGKFTKKDIIIIEAKLSVTTFIVTVSLKIIFVGMIDARYMVQWDAQFCGLQTLLQLCSFDISPYMQSTVTRSAFF